MDCIGHASPSDGIDSVTGFVCSLENFETLAAITKHLRHEGEASNRPFLSSDDRISSLLRISTQSPARSFLKGFILRFQCLFRFTFHERTLRASGISIILVSKSSSGF